MENFSWISKSKNHLLPQYVQVLHVSCAQLCISNLIQTPEKSNVIQLCKLCQEEAYSEMKIVTC